MTSLSDRVINVTPATWRKPVRQVMLGPRIATSRWRVLPSFLIIGGQRCGTTSLYRYIVEHPCCIPPFQKEVHFFDRYHARGLGWYRANFPTRRSEKRVSRRRGLPAITGEATPMYLFHPLAPSRVSQAIPGVKLIVMLRDPVQRAYSHYQHELKLGHESFSFEEALEAEAERLQGERERMLADPSYYSFNHGHFSYLARGIYVEQLRAWEDYFPREQMLVVQSEDFCSRPGGVLREVQGFLGLPPRELARYKAYNQGRYEGIDPRTGRRLREYFKGYNRDLYDYLGRDLGWDG